MGQILDYGNIDCPNHQAVLTAALGERVITSFPFIQIFNIVNRVLHKYLPPVYKIQEKKESVFNHTCIHCV